MSVTSQALIKVENLTKSFGDLEVLKGINEEIHEGEVVSIIGPSGSGKSTFLRCLNLLEVPTDGKVIFEGVNIADKSVNIDTHRQKIGMVFQHFNVFPHLTVLENITITPTLELKMPKEEAEKLGCELLAKVGLLDKKYARRRLARCGRGALHQLHPQHGYQVPVQARLCRTVRPLRREPEPRAVPVSKTPRSKNGCIRAAFG